MKKSIIQKLVILDSELKRLHEEAKLISKQLKEVEVKQRNIRELKYKEYQKIAEIDSKFKVGDKVRVDKAILKGSVFSGNWISADGVVSKVVVRPRKGYVDFEFEYKVNKVKKDGRMSKKALWYNTDTYAESQLQKL